MHLLRTTAFLLAIFACQDAAAQHAILTGMAPQFAGDQLVIRKISNPVTGHSTVIDTMHFEPDGTFNHQLTCDVPQWFFINTGILDHSFQTQFCVYAHFLFRGHIALR